MFNLTLYRWLTGIPRSGLLSILLLLLIFYSQRSNAQTYANTQTNQVNGLCVLCGVVNPNNAVDGSTSTYSSFTITAGLLGVSVEQTLIFPSVVTAGCDSLFVGVGSNDVLIDLNIFQGVTVQTYNGAVPNPDATVLTSSVLQVRILDGENRIIAGFKPADDFDRVKITLSSELVGLLNGFRVYFASYESALEPPVVSPTDTTVCSGESVTFNVSGPSGNTFFWYTDSTGGSVIAIGDNFTTGALTSDTTFYVEGNDGTCTSERVPVNVTVSSAPAAPTVSPTDTTICSGATVSFNATAPAGVTFFWYTEPTGGSVIAIGDNFTTGALTSDTTFYVESNDGTCPSSTRTQVEVTVNPAPAAPTVTPTDTTICAGQTVMFNATAPAGATFFWYTEPAGGSVIAIGDNFTTGVLTSDTTFYVESSDGTCSSATRSQVTVTINSSPEAPTVSPADTTICAGETVSFNATAPAGVTFFWYTEPTGGSLIAIGDNFTTGALTSDTTFYVESSDGTCSSATRTELNVTTLPTPAAPTVTPTDTTICSGQTVTFNASAPAGASFSWYAEAAGGSPVATGSSFTTPALTSNTTYYAESNDGACASGTRTALDVTVLPTPAIPTVAPTDTTICSGQTVTFNASAPAGAVFFWYSEPTGGSIIAIGDNFTTGALTSDTTFYAESNDGACASSTRTELDVTVLPTPGVPTVTPTDTTICSGQTVTFNASAPAGASFNWYTEAAGGSPIATGISFTTGALTTDTTFYVESNDGACSSETRTQLNVIVLPTPAVPTVAPTDTTICSGQTVTFNASAPAGASFNWYTEATGGSPVATGSSFTTGALTTDTTFYAEANDGACASSTRTELDVTVLPTPDAPTAVPTDTTICSGQTVTFNASAPVGAIFFWYTEPTGGSAIAIGDNFTTGSLPSDTTFYVEANDGSCPSSTRTQLDITVLPTPDEPTVTPTDTTICAGQTVTFNATAPIGASFNWYTEPVDGSPVATGSSFTTGALATDTTFYVESNDGTCSSGIRAQLNVTILPTPDAPTVTPTDTTICAGQTVTFNASAPAGASFNWFTSASGGSPVATGSSFTTGALTTDTTFYAESNDGACASSTRTELDVTVLPTPAVPTVTPADTTICSGQAVTFNASAPAGASFNWYTEATGGSPIATGSSFTTPALTSNTTYYAESNDGTCASGTRTELEVTVLPTPDAPTVAPTDTTICSGQTVTFNASAPAGASFSWFTSASGGSPVATGSSFTTPALTSNTTYYAESNDGACTSGTRTELDVTVLPTPAVPTVAPTDTTICSGQTVTFNASAPAGASFNWFTSASGGSPVATGSSFTTPALTSNTTYYAESNDGACASSTRTVLTVTVNPTPAAPTVTPSSATICSGRTATFTSSVSGGSINWYTTPTGGSAVHTGNSFTTPVLTSNTTYYAEAQLGSCASAARTAVNVTVNPTPAAPTVAPAADTICSGQTTTLTVTAPPGTARWYILPSGGSPLYTGTTYTTPVLTSNITFYADVIQGSCASPRTPVNIQVRSLPATPTVSPASATICSGQTATFNMTAPAGSTGWWYTTPSGGSPVFTGNTFTTPVLTSNATYYVAANNGACSSTNRRAVTVTVNPTPAAPTVTPSSASICSGQTATFTASGTGTFNWFTVASGGTSIFTGSTFTTPALTSNTTYYIGATSGSCTSATRTAVTVTVSPTPAAPTVAPSSASICSGQTATFTASGTGTFSWYIVASGGTPVYTGNTFTTPALTSNTTYYVSATSGSCASATRTAVTVTVSPTPAAPTVAPSSASICSGQTATFTASGTGTFNWFTVASGGTSIFTGSTFTTPTLTSNTTYYVSATSGSCASATRTAVAVTVTAAPAAPTVTPSSASICSGQTATFTASGTGTFSWYTVASGGTPIATSNSFTTPALTANTTYYVEAISGTCTSATRTAASVTITSAPSAPVVSPPAESICSGQTATFSATSSPGASIYWYSVASGGTPVHTGSSFTTPALTSPTTYYAEAAIGSCTSLVSRSPAVVTINAAPSAPVVTPSSRTICAGETASFTATAAPGATINWYTAASGGTPVHTGSSFTSPVLTSSTTYYAEATSGGCPSASRTSASVTVQVCQNAVTSFTLVNAINNTDIATLYDGDILDLATLPAGINIRANVYDLATTKSVVFIFSAHPGGRTENGAPFALFGDNNGNYNSWCCANVGTYNLSATPYTGNNASGSAGVGQAIEFQIIDSRIPTIVSYTLVNAGTNTDIGPLVNGQTLNLANLPSQISIRANANNVTHSVYFDFSDNNYDRIENEVPFSLFSDINGDYTPWCCPAPGTYVLKTTPYSELNATGISGPTSEITFYIVSSLRISNIETYPNPADNNIVINVSGDASATSQVIITDMSGKEYYSGSMPIESSRELNLSELRMSSGVYILKVISGDQIETRKIIKK